MNILLLEDEPALSAVASEQIESRGHKVYPAFDIHQAQAIIDDKGIEIDMLIADQMVSDGNGSDFAVEIKKGSSGIKVVVVSGQLTTSDTEKLKANGVDHYEKPSLYSKIVEDMVQKHFSNA